MALLVQADWDAILALCDKDRLLERLSTLPREHWVEHGTNGTTLLHLACRGNNPDAAVQLLLNSPAAVNQRDNDMWVPAHWTCFYGLPAMLRLLCAAPGCDLSLRNVRELTPLDFALSYARIDCARLLVANGQRLRTVQANVPISREMEDFERGVLHCRTAVIALLAFKRRGHVLPDQLDRWVVMEIARAVWATRIDVSWLPPAVAVESPAVVVDEHPLQVADEVPHEAVVEEKKGHHHHHHHHHKCALM